MLFRSVVETDLFDKAIVASLAVVDDDGTVDGVVTLAEAGETDNSCHFNLFLGFPQCGVIVFAGAI